MTAIVTEVLFEFGSVLSRRDDRQVPSTFIKMFTVDLGRCLQ